MHTPRLGTWLLTAALGAAMVGCGDDASDCSLLGSCGDAAGGSGEGGSGTGGNGAGTTGSGGQGGDSLPGCDDPSVPSDACGVFVATSGDDDAADAGSMASPFATIGAAVLAARDSGKRVYACGQTFAENVRVPAGVELTGGWACDAGWTWAPETKTELSPEAGIPLTLEGGAGTTRVTDFALRAADAKVAGTSSIAVLVSSVAAVLERCDAVAGAGADGAPGADAPATPADPGTSGNDGVAVPSVGCDASPRSGGAKIIDNQGNDVSIGGKGGDGDTANGDPGSPGEIGAFGSAGTGQPNSGAWSCAVGQGQPGDIGETPIPGPGASGLGALDGAKGFIGIAGTAGADGKPGQGGGGGGGAKGNASCSGASGGSGGAGGRGGKGGGAGGAAGASLGVVSVGAVSLTLTDCAITTAGGGLGGHGGAGQPGGAGGPGGGGGANGGKVGFLAACSGGDGGQGGDGAPGGGGLGGHSIGIAFVGAAPTQQGATTITPGSAGAGGEGLASNGGASGIAAAVQEL